LGLGGWRHVISLAHGGAYGELKRRKPPRLSSRLDVR
jgi:hypothetical protein